MVRKAVQVPKLIVAHEAISSTTRRTGTKESPILLLSDDEGEGDENIFHPFVVNASPQKQYLGVSPSDAYTFTGHGSAHDIMIAMGYQPDRGLGPDLRGNVRPPPIELRNRRAGVGYHADTASRSPSPAPPLKKAPVKIIRPPREPIASASKTEQPAVETTTQTSCQMKAKVPKPSSSKSTTTDLPQNPLKQSTLPQPTVSPPTVILPPPPPPVPFVPSDLYISLMSGFAMANMPQAMQAAAAADPMAAFQLAQMCFAPTSPFPLPPFSLVPPQPDAAPTHQHPPTPNLPPRPPSTTNSDPKITPVPLPIPPILPEGDLSLVPPPTPTSAPDPFSATIEMDPQVLKQKRQARRNNIGWIPEPGFPDRGTFDLVPTMPLVCWPSSNVTTPPDPQRSLVMEDIPGNCRNIQFVRSWTDKFPATAVYLNGTAKALIEFPSREVAEVAYDSPRLRGGQFDRAIHVRVFWYRPQVEGVATTDGNAGVTGDIEDTEPEVETAEVWRGVQLQGMEKAPSLPPSGLDPPGVDLPVRISTAPMFISGPGSPLVIAASMECDGREQRNRLSLVVRADNISRESEAPASLPCTSPSPSLPPTPPAYTPAPCHQSPSLSPDITQRKRTPTGSPPSLRYPSSTPEMTSDKSTVPSPGEGTSGRDTQFTVSTSDPSPAGDFSLEQRLRMRLLAKKQAMIANRSCERSSSSSTTSTLADPDLDIPFKVVSPPPVSETPNGIAIPESLELLATSFITDTIQAAQSLPSEPERFDIAIKARPNKKRGSRDAFGSSADIAFKRQRLAQQIEESKRIMERWKTAKTKEERSKIYGLWEESNRSVELLSETAAGPFRWPCYAEGWLVIDSDSDDEEMDSS